MLCFFFFQAEDGIRDFHVTGVQTCALPIWLRERLSRARGCDTPRVVARPSRLSHLDRRGRARMVDVSAKGVTAREAVARGEVTMRATTLAAIAAGGVPKGDVLAAARLAGIMAAKRTADLVPLCHPLPLSHVDVELTPDPGSARVRVESRVRVEARTGVEMEALTAVAVACLTLYDMCKAIDRDMTIGSIRLVEKRGGRSGAYRRAGEP